MLVIQTSFDESNQLKIQSQKCSFIRQLILMKILIVTRHVRGNEFPALNKQL